MGMRKQKIERVNETHNIKIVIMDNLEKKNVVGEFGKKVRFSLNPLHHSETYIFYEFKQVL